jgi:para-nitrobenzyl esterase
MKGIQIDKRHWDIGGNAFRAGLIITSTIFIFSLLFGVTGCDYHHDGFHHDDEKSSDSRNEIRFGAFLDSPVQGLHYATETQSGITDENGTFQYKEGETIIFSMGGIVLGKAMAESMMTPIHLVPGAVDETHPTVTNMLRFLQTLDLDYDPENGITVPSHILVELEGRPIHFDMDISEFEHNADMQLFMDTLHEVDENYENRIMVPIEDAQEHMRETMMHMMNE